MGNVTPVDSAYVYIENIALASSVLTIGGSATGTYNSSDITCLSNVGLEFFINFTSIAGTCTVRYNVQAKDPISGNYLTVASLSLDALTASNVTNGPLFIAKMYPGIGTAAGGQVTNFSDGVSRVMRVQASITATASTANGAITSTVGVNKLI